jgi:hypothetical protein
VFDAAGVGAARVRLTALHQGLGTWPAVSGGQLEKKEEEKNKAGLIVQCAPS